MHASTKASGVIIPQYLYESPTVTLKLSIHFQGNVTIEENEILADLSFSGEYFNCKVPLKAIWGVTTPDNNTQIWPDDGNIENNDNTKYKLELAPVASKKKSNTKETNPPKYDKNKIRRNLKIIK